MGITNFVRLETLSLCVRGLAPPNPHCRGHQEGDPGLIINMDNGVKRTEERIKYSLKKQ
jgi:hypothetical protein